MEAFVQEIADKPACQVLKMSGSTNGLIIETVSLLVSGRTVFIHKVTRVDNSNFINMKNDLITQIFEVKTSNLNRYDFQRAFLAAESYLFVRFDEMEKTVYSTTLNFFKPNKGVRIRS